MITTLRAPDLFAGMNRLEAKFAMSLEAQRRAGKIVLWRYERLTLKLADDTRYTPDFYVLELDGAVSIYETKGYMRDDAHVKLKVAATAFPEFRFYLVQKGVIKPVRGIP
jgi:hypothetical protein